MRDEDITGEKLNIVEDAHGKKEDNHTVYVGPKPFNGHSLLLFSKV